MKCRLHQTPLAAVQFAFAGEKPVAKDGPGGAQTLALDEVPVVRDQNVTDEIGMIHLEDATPAKAEASDIHAACCEAGDIVERIAPQPEQSGKAVFVFDRVGHSAAVWKQVF